MSRESEREERERLFAAQGRPSSLDTSQASRLATTFFSYGTSISEVTSEATSEPTSEPTPTPTDSSLSTESSSPSVTPPTSQGPILQAQGPVPRDISVATGAPALLLWNLRPEGQLWKLDYGGAWEAYPDRRFLVSPITIRTSASTQTAVSINALNGRIVYMHFRDSTWGEWQELDFAAGFLRRPAVVSRAQGKIDVVNVDSDGYVWVVSYDGENWSDWTELGSEFTSDIAATSLGEDRIDVFGKRGLTVLHKQWTSNSGWAQDWEDLGDTFANTSPLNDESSASSPLVVSWRDAAGDTIIDVVINHGGSSHRLFSNGAWSEWTGMFASHEGVEFPDTQSIVRSDGADSRPLAHLVSRGTDDCIHYNVFNGTGWGSWTYLWCARDADERSGNDYPTQFLPTFVADAGPGELEVVARNLAGSVLRLQIHGAPVERWSNDDWEDLGKPGG